MERGRAYEVAASLAAGLRFALDVLRDQPHPEVIVVSDGHLGAARERLERSVNVAKAELVNAEHAIVERARRTAPSTLASRAIRIKAVTSLGKQDPP